MAGIPTLDSLIYLGTPVHIENQSSRKNSLLCLLPVKELRRLETHLESVHLIVGQVLYQAGIAPKSVYFPTNSTISLRHLLKDGASYSGATVGREGFVGIAVLLGGKATLGRAVVQSAGWSFRLQATHLMEELARCGPVLHLLLRYTHAHFVQVAQNAVCSRHHSIDQQLARWLLQAMDGLDSDDLVLTHERVSDDLGVRRVSVTLSAGKYQRLGYIGLVRGHIVVLNRPALEQSACECYGVVRSLFQRLVLDIGQGDPQGVLD